MSKIKLYAVIAVVLILFYISIFFYGKRKGKEEVNVKTLKKVLKVKDIDSLSFNELYNILSKRVYK